MEKCHRVMKRYWGKNSAEIKIPSVLDSSLGCSGICNLSLKESVENQRLSYRKE